MIPFAACGRLPADGDNVAIATRQLDAGTVVDCGDRSYAIAHTVLEGHRFAHVAIERGQSLLSWGLPFGDALRALQPGDYVCNQRMLDALPMRGATHALPQEPNLQDRFERLELDASRVVSGEQVATVGELAKNAAPSGTFAGFRRPGNRGVGTRNFVLVLGLTATDAPAASAIVERLRADPSVSPGVDAELVAVTHTEGGGRTQPHNLEFVLRALAGFVVHSNTAAVVLVDRGAGSFGARDLETFMRAEGYAIDAVPHVLVGREQGDPLSNELGFEAVVQAGGKAAGAMLAKARGCERTEEPLSELKIALQCGGSDAFSGVSGNALAGYVAKQLIRHGGAANLAETDELIGAESYVLDNVRDVATAQRFVDKIATFEARARRHGASAEGNPSGGNLYRGLYNITLKSLGAARKKDPDVRLDGVLDYGQPIPGGGYWFMDSPGNDLESIAGQVATGCNVILFITGNGSITNFPFVPTLKFVTTTGRFEMLRAEMDVNAGRYNDGLSMADLGDETFELLRRVASGELTKGERAGHAQVSLWREWRQGEDAAPVAAALSNRAELDGVPHALVAASSNAEAAGRDEPLELSFSAYRDAASGATRSRRMGLIMPTSLCSGQVALQIAARLNQLDTAPGNLEYVGLAHTEGCGSANAEHYYLETLRGHLRHPFVEAAVLLEHGCEKTHNDAVTGWLRERGEDPSRFGLVSVQQGGGIERAQERVLAWFGERLSGRAAVGGRVPVGVDGLRLGVQTERGAPAWLVGKAASLSTRLVLAGATVVVAEGDALLEQVSLHGVAVEGVTAPTLAYGQYAERPGMHVMSAPTADPTERVTGLGGTGIELLLSCGGGLQGGGCGPAHPMIPLLRVGIPMLRADGADADFVVTESAPLDDWLPWLVETLSGRYEPKSTRLGNHGFQLTRGAFGISL
ncbi:MAG: UxaA family hydrolase [Planctomycetota bacterium]